MSLAALGTGTLNYYDGTEWVAVGGAATPDNFTPLHDMTWLSRSFVRATASGTAHTKGAWSEIIASAASEINFISMICYGVGSPATVTSVLFDVGVGAAGSEVAVMENIAIGGATWSVGGPELRLSLPITIASGSRVAIRIQAVQTTPKTADFLMMPYSSGPATPTSLTTFGGNTATSRGVDITSANTWTQISASLPEQYDYLMVVPSQANNSVISTAQEVMDVGVGASGSETVWRSFGVSRSVSEATGYVEATNFYALIEGPAAGSRLSVRVPTANVYSITAFGAKLP